MLKVLVQALQAAGAEAKQTFGHRDCRGEDGILEINGKRTVVQITTIPSNIWERLARGDRAVLKGDKAAAVSLVREAVLRKATAAGGTLLALDATQVGVLIKRSLVKEYRSVFPDSCEEFGYWSVWVIGPTARSSIQLG